MKNDFWRFFKSFYGGCSRFFRRELTSKVPKSRKKSAWGVVLIIWVIRVIIFVKIWQAFCRAFAAGTVNFDKNNHNDYQNNEDVLHDFQRAAAAFFPGRINVKSAKKFQDVFFRGLC